jgi:hypothetical protein
LDEYKGPVTRSKSNQLHSPESENHTFEEEKKLLDIDEREERQEERIEERREERNEEIRE